MTIPTATAARIAGRPSFRHRVVVIGGILALVVTVKPWDWLAPDEAILVGTWYELPDDRPGVRWMELWPDRTIVAGRNFFPESFGCWHVDDGRLVLSFPDRPWPHATGMEKLGHAFDRLNKSLSGRAIHDVIGFDITDSGCLEEAESVQMIGHSVHARYHSDVRSVEYSRQPPRTWQADHITSLRETIRSSTVLSARVR